MSVLVGKAAPDFTADAVLADGSFKKISLSDYKGKKYVVLFFYPLDFTFVCPSEIIAFDHRNKKFEDKDVQLIGVSVDSKYSHWAWRNTKVKDGGIGEVSFPLVADITKQIARDYDVLVNEAVALRGSFLVDKDGVVQHQVVNNLPLGRNIDEMLRMVDALQFHEEHGEVCPAGWQDGKAGMKENADGVASYLSKHARKL
jgi:peroxiredoxin (alkyl hydroperoxide reductase subunit C)